VNVTLQTFKTTFCKVVADTAALHPILRTHWAAALSRLADRDEPQMLIRRDNFCQNDWCFTGKLPELTQYLCKGVKSCLYTFE